MTESAVVRPARPGPRLVGSASTALSLAASVATAGLIASAVARQPGRATAELILVIVLHALNATMLQRWSGTAAWRVRDRWRQGFAQHLRVPRAEGERGRGDLLQAAENAAEGPGLEALSAAAQASALGLVLVGAAAGWPSVAIVLALIGLAVPLYRRAGHRSAALVAEFTRRRGLLERRQLELLVHAPELRALGAVDFAVAEIGALSDHEHRAAERALRVALESSLVTEFVSGVSVGLVAMVVGFDLLGGRLSLVRAMIAVLATADVFGAIRRYGVAFHRREAADAARLVLEVPATATASHGIAAIARADRLVSRSAPWAVSFRVAPGDHLLLSGPSGAGKTSLLHTLLGWRPAAGGTAAIAPGAVGFVAPTSGLLTATLRDNVTLGRPVPPDEVRELLDQLGLAGPRFDDLDRALLADGSGLSTGERVRVVLARALMASPRLLVLDDIGGVLDEDSRRRVANVIAVRPDLAVIEATASAPVVPPSQRIEVPT